MQRELRFPAIGKAAQQLGWGAASLKSRHRESFIGWDERTKHQRLYLVANNVRLLVLPRARVPHLASAVLARSVQRLSADWEARYDHPIMLAETFVDLSRFQGACYRAANWRYLGQTRGMRRQGRGYEEHGQKRGCSSTPFTSAHKKSSQHLFHHRRYERGDLWTPV